MKLTRLTLALIILIHTFSSVHSQDTFSIVAVDSVTGEVGSAGASCVDLILFFPNYTPDFLGDLLPGIGAINTQASYNATNQANARTRMLAGDTPAQIISWLIANDAQSNSTNRQYGITALVNGSPQTAGFTGSNCLNYKNHVTGPNYCIQGNILLNQAILDSMEARFLNEPGDLACKLMAAMQGAKVVGADTRCTSNGTSSLFAFLKVAQQNDPIGSPSLLFTVKTPGGSGIEPIDSLQNLFNAVQNCSITGMPILTLKSLNIYPNPATNAVTISGKDAADLISFQLYDMKGRLLRSERISELPLVLDLQSFKEGIYMLELSGPSQPTYHKIIKE
jgi:uncharacterized Ntn-hydrolase superfamily protein